MKINLKTVIFLAGVSLIVFNHCALAHTDVTVEQAKGFIDYTYNLIVVDVREPSEYCDVRGHIPGAINLPLNSGVLEVRYEELPIDRPILVVCRSGGRSNRAANFLDSQGFTMVYEMQGGMSAWVWETVPCKYSGGSGTALDPYRIATAEDLAMLGWSPEDYDKHFILTADIDLDPNLPGLGIFNKAVIADSVTSFAGVFDGNGHTIANLTIRGHRYLGLFGLVRTGAEIRDLGVVNVDIVGSGDSVGGLLAGLWEGSVINCYSTGAVSGNNRVGGLVGNNSFEGSIINSYSTGAVSGNNHVGGLVGHNSFEGSIINSYSTGAVSGNEYVGGLVGNNVSSGRITCSYAACAVIGDESVGGLAGNNESIIAHCYAWGNVEGITNVGGLVGVNGSFLGGTITNCYATGSVSGTEDVGGLVGAGNQWGMDEVTFSFWDIETSGQETSNGGTGKTTAEMQDPNTFIDAGWDFVDKPGRPSNIWAEPAGGGYPILWWQLSPTPPLPTFSGGTGEPDDPYLISTAADLNSIGHNPRLMVAHFKLTNDIDLEEIGFYIIGTEAFPFTGVFDGNGFMISNFSYTSIDTDYVGLFGHVDDPNAEIRDLRLIDPNIEVGASALFYGECYGALVGGFCRGTITNCYVDNGSVTGITDVGGLVGSNSHGTITNCYSSAAVSGGWAIGGLVGESYSGTITGCYSSDAVSSGQMAIGGLVGYINKSVISNCYAEGGDVSGYMSVGGLVGESFNSTIADCYSTNSVTEIEYGIEYGEDVGGLVGRGGYAHNSFWDIQASGQSTGEGGKGRTTTQMQMASTFLGWDGCGNEGVWTIDEGNDYPRLWWENRPGEVLETQQLSDLLTGAGTEDEPYLIYTAEELNVIGVFPCEWNKHFKLMADIDLSQYEGAEFNIIGIPNPFAGVFDGNGKRIINLNHASGLFVSVRGTIMNLGLVNVNVGAGRDDQVGSLVNYLKGGTITSCNSNGGSVSGTFFIGGLVGENWGGTIANCYTTNNVSGLYAVGGLVGHNFFGGGIINSYSTGSVSGEDDVGGLVGSVVQEGMVEVTFSFWDIQTSGQETSAGGTGKTTAEMQTASTFLDAGWDFMDESENGTEDIWWILEGQDYPSLWWELMDDESTVIDIVISNPIPDERFVRGEEISFSVTMSGRSDLDGFQLEWTSDKDGDLGTGVELTLDNLSTGSHVIEVCGYGVCASISVRIYEDLWELYQSPPAEGEIARILNDFSFNLIDGEESDEKWDAYEPVFDQNSTEPSFLVAISKIDILRHQRFSTPVPFANGQTLYDHFKTYVKTVNLRLDCGYNTAGGDRVNLNRNFSVWDSRMSGTASNPNACKTPFANHSLNNYISPVYLLLHEGRHCEPTDPGHRICDGRPKDEMLEDGSGYAQAALYLMWVYKYGLYDPPFIRSEARSSAAMFLNDFLCTAPTHSDPNVQAIIDELLN